MQTVILNSILCSNPAASALLNMKHRIADAAIARLPAKISSDDTAALNNVGNYFRDTLKTIGVEAVEQLADLDLDDHPLDVCDAIIDAFDCPQSDISPRDYIVLHEAARFCDKVMSRELFGS